MITSSIVPKQAGHKTSIVNRLRNHYSQIHFLDNATVQLGKRIQKNALIDTPEDIDQDSVETFGLD